MKSGNLPAVLACGAWLKNAACLFVAGRAVWSPVHGDLSDPEACRALERSVRLLLGPAPRAVRALAHDLHPDFYCTRMAIGLARELGVPAIGVQHHHAHIAAVMAEHDVQEAVVGLALDGVGLGTDGTAWGGELLWVGPQGWQRLGHLSQLVLPGGDVAAREPWRMAAAALHALGRTDEVGDRFEPSVGRPVASGVQRMLTSGIHCPVTSSTGRWFDAAAGALGLSVRQGHEAEAAIALEQMAQTWLAQYGTPQVRHGVDTSSLALLDIRPLLTRLLDIGSVKTGVAAAAAWFHLALADALADWAALAARHCGARTVCLGGGCFLNAVLTARVISSLQQRGLRVLMPVDQSCGDAGLAWGQAWVAAHTVEAHTDAAPEPRHFSSLQPETESLPCA